MTFCHNGDCPTFSNTQEALPLLGNTTRQDINYHPVGDTDSEAVFCAILNALSVEFPDALPTLPVLHEFLSIICNEITHNDPETIFNFLLGCGQYTQFAYSWPGRRPGSSVWNGLHYLIREPPFQTAKLLDTDYTIDFAAVTTPSDRVAVITTKPLTEEPGWTEFKRGELLMFDKGLPYRTPKCCEAVELQGRGLYSKSVKAKCAQRSPLLSSLCQRSDNASQKHEPSSLSPLLLASESPSPPTPAAATADSTASAATVQNQHHHHQHSLSLPTLSTCTPSALVKHSTATRAETAPVGVRRIKESLAHAELKKQTTGGAIAHHEHATTLAAHCLQRLAIQ